MKNISVKIFSAVLISLLAMSVLLWTQVESLDLFKKTDRASYKIEYLDEVLTMSARMAAFTGEAHWIERYHNHEMILNEVLQKAQQDENVSKQLKTINQANDALVAIEKQAIALVKNDRKLEAQELLCGVDYLRYKNTYTKGLKDIVEYVNEQVDENSDKISSNFRYSLLTIIFLFITSSLFGLYIVNVLQSYNKKLVHMTKELDHLARTDALTGLFNRRYCDEYLDERIKISQRFHKSFSVILLDVDYFKAINDSFGHEKGDHILSEVAKVLNASLRDVDKIFRWGGEEFVIILPYTELESSLQLAEKIRQKVERHNFQIDKPVTASFGVVHYTHGLSAKEIMACADDALYKAKSNGRNQVINYAEIEQA